MTSVRNKNPSESCCGGTRGRERERESGGVFVKFVYIILRRHQKPADAQKITSSNERHTGNKMMMRKFWDLIEWQENTTGRERSCSAPPLPCHFIVELVLAGPEPLIKSRAHVTSTWRCSRKPTLGITRRCRSANQDRKAKKTAFLIVEAKWRRMARWGLLLEFRWRESETESVDWQAHREAWRIHEWAGGVNASGRRQQLWHNLHGKKKKKRREKETKARIMESEEWRSHHLSAWSQAYIRLHANGWFKKETRRLKYSTD